MTRAIVTAAACATLLWATSVQAGLTARAKCEATKNQEAGKYAKCKQNAQAKLVKRKGACSISVTTACYREEECLSGGTCNKDLTKYNEAVTKCELKFAEKWQKAIDKAAEAGATCPDGRSTDDDFQTVADICSSHVATGLATGSELSILPASGQTTCYLNGSSVLCSVLAVKGEDGRDKAGATLSYTDNPDGKTITDNNTGLMWEKKDDSGALHDMDNAYVWSGACSRSGLECLTDAGCPPVPVPQTCVGSTIFEWLAQVNAEGGTGFAGHNDWRIPNVKELQSIIDFENYDPAVSAAFDTNCTPSCTSCSCTQSDGYWSSTTDQFNPDYAWFVSFSDGLVSPEFYKSDYGFYVRAVRGGL